MKKLSSQYIFVIGLLSMMCPYIVWYSLGENSFVQIHDNLDSEFVFINLLYDSNNLFGFKLDDSLPEIMNGIPRFLFRSGFNFTFLLIHFLSPIYAYITHHLIVHLIGYIGMFLLLEHYIISDKPWLVVSLSLIFGCVSYYHIQYGISISGQPILLFAFLNLLNQKAKWYDWGFIITFPFFSFLVVTLPFFVPILFTIGLFHFYKYNTIPIKFVLAIILICVINVVVEFPLVFSTLIHNEFVSHRTAWNLNENFQIKNILDSIIFMVKKTHYHSGVLYPLPIIISLLIGLSKKWIIRKYLLIYLTSLIVLIILWFGLNKFLVSTLFQNIQLFKVFNSERFYFLLPMLWIILFGIVLNDYNWRSSLWKNTAIVLVILLGVSAIKNNDELVKNLKISLGRPTFMPSFKQFYATDLFNKIKNKLASEGSLDHNFLSIGIFPNILQYNGLKTLDSYQNNYSLAYKNEFRKIIETELNKNNSLKDYFDNWGSRCYTFSAELGKNYLFPKTDSQQIEHLNLNIDQVKEMHGMYIISSVMINDFHDSRVKYIDSFTDEEAYWRLFLYEIN